MQCIVPNEPPFVFSCIPCISIFTLWTIFLCNDYYCKYTILWYYVYYVCPIAVFYIPIIRIPIKGFLLKPPTRYVNWVHIRVVVSDIFYVHPYLGKIPILTNIFQMGWNHQPGIFLASYFNRQFNPPQPRCRPFVVLVMSWSIHGWMATVKVWRALGFSKKNHGKTLDFLWKWWVFMFYTLKKLWVFLDFCENGGLSCFTPWSRLTANSPTAISHEKKGKWSEQNLHEDMFHVNLPGCTFSWTYWKSVVVYFLTWDENHHCSLPFKMWGVFVGELFRSIEEANPSNTKTENKHGKLFLGGRAGRLGVKKNHGTKNFPWKLSTCTTPTSFRRPLKGCYGQCFQQSWWWSSRSSHSWYKKPQTLEGSCTDTNLSCAFARVPCHLRSGDSWCGLWR